MSANVAATAPAADGRPQEDSGLLESGRDVSYSTPKAPSVHTTTSDSSSSGSAGHATLSVKEKSVLATLLLGCFLANAVGAVVLATNQYIASEFHALSSAAWLLTIYTLAQCASQPLYGKLTDIYGARRVLAFCWLMFVTGDLIVASAQTYWQALLGRAISGIGSAGMISLASVVVTAIVPLHEVATYRAYINVTATAARASGGPIGAWVSGSVDWRWCFLIPCPITVCGLVFILWKLPELEEEKSDETVPVSKLSRIDFPGAAGLVGFVLSFLLLLDRVTKKTPLFITIPLGVTSFVFLGAFIYTERYIAKEPILPLQLLGNRDVHMPYLIVACKSAGQFTLLYSIPIYFIIVQGEGVAAAGSRIVPVVIGNAVGTVLSGRIISKRKRYRTLTLCAIGMALAGWILILIRWNSALNMAESLYVLLPGFGMGTIQSSTFIHLAASLERKEMSIAGTVWFLAQSFGYLIGASVSTAVINTALQLYLERNLEGLKDKAKIISMVTSNIEDVRRLPERTQSLVAQAYVSGLHWAHGLSIFFLIVALVITAMLKERMLQ